MIERFAEWLSLTSLSVLIQTHNSWIIPGIQSIHIVSIGVVVASVLMVNLRILGWAGRDQTLRETTDRFGPWLSTALVALLLTGALMVVGEPVRELLAFSFWFKMILIAIGVSMAVGFKRSLRRHETRWEQAPPQRSSVKALAIATLLIWVAIIVLGRLIAYDHVWGSWSHVPSV